MQYVPSVLRWCTKSPPDSRSWCVSCRLGGYMLHVICFMCDAHRVWTMYVEDDVLGMCA